MQEERSSITFCPKCGASNDDAAAFCKSCGSALPQTSPSTPSTGAGQTPPPSPSVPPNTRTASFQMASAFNDAISLITNPQAFMQKNKDVSVSVNTIMINYVAVLDVVPFVAFLLGSLWYYHFSSLVAFAFTGAILTYIFDLIGVFVTGFIIWKLAPTFGASMTQARGTLIAAWIFTPAFLISILDIIPFVSWITFLGIIYGIYILYLGLPILTNTPKDKVVPYVIGVLIAAFIVYVVLSAIVGIAVDAAFVRSVGYY